MLPLERDGEGEAYYYEAQISFLMIGIDEWLWTTYCCVDTFFGSETDREAYLNPHCPTDAASGGSLFQKYPVWNPRQYFLAVLSRRMLQARYEWTTLVECYTNRLSTYVSYVEFHPVSFHKLTHYRKDLSRYRTMRS